MLGYKALKQTFFDQKTKTLNLLFLGFYLIWVIVAEGLTVYLDPQLGLWLHVGLLTVLLIHGVLDQSRPTRRVWLCLSFVPIIRIISLATPLVNFPLIYWYMLTGIPLFIAAWVFMRYLGLPRRELALQARWTPGQLMVGISGLALGYVEYLILRPDPLASPDNPWALLDALLILIVFTGLLEEIIFRGMMQGTTERVIGKKGVVYVALIFTMLHLGYRSIADMVFVFGVALYFGFYVYRTRSILGVALAHGLINVALFLIFPFVLGSPDPVTETVDQVLLAPHAVEITPTPFLPMTPTPFLPNRPTSTPKSTPTATHTPPPSPTPILIDDGDEGFSTSGGRWWIEPAGFGEDLHWDFAVPEFATVEIEWRPQLEICGRYALEVYLAEPYLKTRSAQYLIGHAEGTTTVVVDQSAHQGQWASLGQYSFDPGGDNFLLLSNATGETISDLIVVFDAARWSYLGPCSDSGDTPVDGISTQVP